METEQLPEVLHPQAWQVVGMVGVWLMCVAGTPALQAVSTVPTGVAADGTHWTWVQLGSAQSIRPSPLLSRPSRQSLSGMRTHALALQVKLVWQSAGTVQLVLQALVPQAKPPGQVPP